MKILKEIHSPSETTYTIAKYWPFMGGAGIAFVFFLPAQISIIWMILVWAISNTIIIRGAQTLPVSEELIRDRNENPPQFSVVSYFFLALPILSFVLLVVSTKFFAMAFSLGSIISLLLLSAVDYSLKRVFLLSLPSIVISFSLLSQHTGTLILTYCAMLALLAPMSIEACIKNNKLRIEIQKANQAINHMENSSVIN